VDTVSSIKVPPKSFEVEVLTKSVHASAVANSQREAGGDILVQIDFICLKSLQITLLLAFQRRSDFVDVPRGLFT